MMPERINSNVSRQEFIELLCRITNTDEETSTNIVNEPEVTIIDDNSVVEEGEIITLDDEEEEGEGKKEVEDGEITGSDIDDDDDVEELNLRLHALRSLAGAKKQKHDKPKRSRPRRQYSNDNRYLNGDIDLRSTIRKRTSSRHLNQPLSNNEDREYLLDKDYRQSSVFDMLVSLISPDNKKKLVDNYDIQQMDIVEDYPVPPSLPLLPPPPPSLPQNHLPFFDPLPPLPPPPPLFNFLPVNQSYPTIEWPRPNFVSQNSLDLWSQHPTDIDLRIQPSMPTNHATIPPLMGEQISPQPQPPLPPVLPSRRKRSKKSSSRKYRYEPEVEVTTAPPNQNETIEEPSDKQTVDANDDDDDIEERLLREQLLRTLTNKRKVKAPEPDRIVTIISSKSPPPPLLTTAITITTATAPVVVNSTPPAADVNKSQYSINQRYKRVKANASATNIANKTETTTTTTTLTTTTVVRTAQPIIQTRNKIVRASDNDPDVPQSNPIIITFDDPTTDEDDHQPEPPLATKELSHPFPDEERQAIKRLQQVQEDVVRSRKSKPPAPIESVQEAIPSTDELSALFEKRRMLLAERSKYKDIQEKTKKKKLENGLLARDIERLEEQLATKKAQITNNNALLQYWQKEAMGIAQNIKQQEDLILQSAIFKSAKSNPSVAPAVKSRSTIELDYENLSKMFKEKSSQLLLSILICPLSFYQKLRSYQLWFKTISQKIPKVSFDDDSCLLLRTRSFSTENSEQYWQTCLQSYFLDINQILCPYELQGSCKDQHCIYQHQYQITNRIERFLSSKTFDEKNKLTLLNKIESLCSLQSFDFDLSIFEKKIADKQYQRCRTLLDRYLSIYHEDFRYFRDQSNSNCLSVIHPILTSVSNQLESDEFSLERAVAELVEGLEFDRTNAQLWCLYLEFSSWHMSSEEIQHLCHAAIKNAQSYDLFWTSFYLCTKNLEDFISIYLLYIQSNEFDFHNRSYAICELALFHASLTHHPDDACQKIKTYLSNTLLENEHRIYLVLILLYTFVFGSFPHILYQQIDENRFEKSIEFEPFICPWYTLSSYAHTQHEIDRFFDDFMTSMELIDVNLPLYMNKLHFLNATKRYEQSKLYIETLIDVFPYSIELWIELLLNPQISSNLTETLDRAKQSTGIYYEFVYCLSSSINIQDYLKFELISPKTFREKFFFDLCHLIDCNNQELIERKLLKYTGELRDIFILHIFFRFSTLSMMNQQKILSKIFNSFHTNNEQEKFLIVYSFFRQIQIGRVFDYLLDWINNEQFQWIIKPFLYRLMEKNSNENKEFWFRFDAFLRHLIIHSHCEEIYLTILQRLMTSMEDKNKITHLCRLFEKHYPNHDLISSQYRQMIFNSINLIRST